jgi:hypothetical protein
MKDIKSLLLILLLALSTSFAQEVKDKVKLSGLMFGDYYYNIDNSDGAKKDLNGFQFRRIYITADYAVADNFDARFRLESDQSANSNTAGGKIGVMVKDAYIKWKGVFTGSDLTFGVSPTPAFDIAEAAWGYRSVEKTIMDYNGIVSSRDLGVDLRGKITESGSVNYWVKIANNSGNASETDKYKRYYALVQVKPAEGFQATGYFDYASKAQVTDKFDKSLKSNDAVVAGLFLNYQLKSDFAVGFEGFTRSIQNGYNQANSTTALKNQSTLGLSFWAWASLTEKIRVVARYDNYDPNTDKDNDGTSLIVAGLDFKVAKNVSIIPNIEVLTYQTAPKLNGSTSTKDFQGKVTMAISF